MIYTKYAIISLFKGNDIGVVLILNFRNIEAGTYGFNIVIGDRL